MPRTSAAARAALLALGLLLLPARALAQDTWCGKVYKPADPVVPPGGHFAAPPRSPTPLLALRCSPALAPFLPDDVGQDTSAIVVDALVRYVRIAGAQPVVLPEGRGGEREVQVEEI